MTFSSFAFQVRCSSACDSVIGEPRASYDYEARITERDLNISERSGACTFSSMQFDKAQMDWQVVPDPPSLTSKLHKMLYQYGTPRPPFPERLINGLTSM